MVTGCGVLGHAHSVCKGTVSERLWISLYVTLPPGPAVLTSVILESIWLLQLDSALHVQPLLFLVLEHPPPPLLPRLFNVCLILASTLSSPALRGFPDHPA